MPRLAGTSSSKREAFPAIGASRGWFFVGANPDAGALLPIGGFAVRKQNWRVGLALNYDFIEPRDESEDAHLGGLGDIDRSTSPWPRRVDPMRTGILTMRSPQPGAR
jgi:outer membrane protein